MKPTQYLDNQLQFEQSDVRSLAERFGTPLYLYSKSVIEQSFLAYRNAAGERDTLICYAVKANSNLAVLQLLARLGAGFDIVSGGELERVLAAGGDPAKVVFSGVGKTAAEMTRALEVGVHCFNVESEAELDLLNQVAAGLGRRAKISLRVNPDVDPKTHPYISTGLKENKFGIDIRQAPAVYGRAAAMAGIEIAGVDCHIGSQLTQLEPYSDAIDRVLALVDHLQADGITLSHIDMGGGIGIDYTSDDQPPAISDLMQLLESKLQGRDLSLVLEPGRSIVGNAGVLVTEVLFLKRSPDKNFAIVDAAMNDNIRPSLYQAYQTIMPVQQRDGNPEEFDVVGPICESGDFLGKNRALNINAGDLLAVCDTGAYGFGMSSNYNSRPRVAEVLVDGSNSYLVRERESFADLIRGEHLLP